MRIGAFLKNYYSPTIYFLLGFLAFSPFCGWLVLEYLQFPVSLTELFLLALIPFLPNEFKKCFAFNFSVFIKSLTLLLLLLLVGIIYGEYSLYSLVACFRIYLYLIICLSFSVNKRGPDINILSIIAIGSVIGWIFCSFYTLSHFDPTDSETSLVTIGNMLAVPLVIFSTLMSRKTGMFVISLIICIILSFACAMRRELFVLVEAIIFCAFLYKGAGAKTIKRSIITVSVLLIILFPQISGYLKEEYPLLHYRIIEKSSQLISGEKEEADKEREKEYGFFYNSILIDPIPKGLVSRNTAKDDLSGLFIDLPLAEVIYTFGNIGGICFILKFYSYYYKCRKRYQRNKDVYRQLVMFMILIMGSLLFVEGTFLSANYTVPVTGFFIGQLIYLGKKEKNYKYAN